MQIVSGISTEFRWRCWALTGLLGLLLQAHTGQAQFDKAAHPVDVARGYWRLKTLANTRSTVAQFFGPGQKLLYEEILPEKWVRLTAKNERQFDRLLAQLLANQLLASRITLEDLPPTPVQATAPRRLARSEAAQRTELMVQNYLVHAYVNPTGRLYVIVDNPDRFRYSVKVFDQRDRSVYEEFTNHDQYRRKLDLSALPQDSYRVVVTINNNPVVYTVRRQENRFVFADQLQGVDNKQVIGGSIKEDSKNQLVPVTIEL